MEQDVYIYFGIVRSPEHLQKLEAVTEFLDKCKFPCTLSTINELAMLTVARESDVDDDWTKEQFEKYVMEMVIHALVKYME